MNVRSVLPRAPSRRPSVNDHRRNERRLRNGFALVAAFMVVEAVGGWIANSLTLLADAGHMFLDASALGFSWLAMRLSRRAANARLTYGYDRFQVLAAFVNALALFGLSGAILYEAFTRLGAPEPMLPLPALAVAAIGFVVNVVVYRMLHGSDNLNVRSAALHVLGDLLGSVAAMVAATCVLLFGWLYADPILAIVIAAILVRGAWTILRESGHILLQGVPAKLDLDEIRAALTTEVAGVVDIHGLHAWALTNEKPLLTLHARLDPEADGQSATSAIKAVLTERFGIELSTVQIEQGRCPDA